MRFRALTPCKTKSEGEADIYLQVIEVFEVLFVLQTTFRAEPINRGRKGNFSLPLVSQGP